MADYEIRRVKKRLGKHGISEERLMFHGFKTARDRDDHILQKGAKDLEKINRGFSKKFGYYFRV